MALALDEAERAGSLLLYRVGPPFVRAFVGQEPHPALDVDDLAAIRQGGLAEDAVGGLVVVGSHVATTTRQLDALVAESSPTRLELEVPSILGTDREAHLDSLVGRAVAALADGNVVLSTSRELVTGTGGEESLAISRSVSDALVDVVRRVVAVTAARDRWRRSSRSSPDEAILSLPRGGPVLVA